MSYLSVQLFPAKTGLAWAAVQLAGRGPVLAGCLVSLSLLFFDLPPSLLLVFFLGFGGWAVRCGLDSCKFASLGVAGWLLSG